MSTRTLPTVRRASVLAGALALSCSFGWAQTPANDECSGATPLVIGENGPFDSTGATTSAPAFSCGVSGGTDVWHSFTAPCPGRVTFATCGLSGMDTVLELYTGTCGALTSAACGDDDCGSQSSVTYRLDSGSTYYLRVGTNGGAEGTYSVLVTHQGVAGLFTTFSTGCGAVTLAASGAPNVGGSLSYDLSGFTGIPYMWWGLQYNPALPICPLTGCSLGAELGIALQISSAQFQLPCDPTILGGQLACQGAELFLTPGSCPANAAIDLVFTDTIVVTVQ